MRKRVILVCAISLSLGCGDTPPGYSPMGGGSRSCTPTATQVCMVGNKFNPSNLVITHGTAVTWMNGDKVTHTVGNATGSAEVFTSNFIGEGQLYSHTFATPGTFQYYCAIHGVDGSPPTGMHGTITVN